MCIRDSDYPISDDHLMEVTQIRDPKLSPDKKQLAFTALNRLYVMDYPSGTPRRLTNNEFSEAFPTWSPDSKSIAFVTWENKSGYVYKINSNGSGLTKLTTETGYYSNLCLLYTSFSFVFHHFLYFFIIDSSLLNRSSHILRKGSI